MTRITSIKDIKVVYEQMLQNKAAEQAVNNDAKSVEVVEEKAVKKLESFPKAADKKINVKKIISKGSDPKAFFHKNSGPQAAEGVKPLAVDPKTAKKDNFYEPQKFSSALEKTETEDINNDMKSIFDKLFEDVMGGKTPDVGLDAGLGAGPEGAEGDAKDLDLSTGEDTVTLKLDKDLAQKLHDALVEVLGSEDQGEDDAADLEVSDAEEAEEDKEEDKKDEEEEVASEKIEAEELGHSLVGSGVKGGAPTSPKGQANVVKGVVSSLAKHGKGGDGKVTDKVGNDGDKGHALVGSGVKGGAPTSPKGRANVVPGVIKGGGNQNLFQ